MNKRLHLSRRGFLKIGGGAVAAAAGAHFLPRWAGKVLRPITPAQAAALAALTVDHRIHMAATDGFVHFPGSVPTFHPDPIAPAPFTTYAFGFRDVTALDPSTSGTGQVSQLILDQKNKTQASAPLFGINEGEGTQITLTNLGLQIRPDLTDSHTIHFHGFRNAIPLFDGVPEMSIAVPIGRSFPYFYHPHDPGTYMWHCHFEDVEHVSMGMTGIVFVRPLQNKNGNGAGAPVARLGGNPGSPVLGYVYNDSVSNTDPDSTAYDREFGMFLSEVWAEERYRDAHIQENDWSEYNPDIWALNGRSYPDTIAPPGGGTDLTTGDLIAPPGRPDLQYQPISSLVNCNAGERVLLRFVDLGYQQHAMTIDGITMKIVGKDATLLKRGPTFNYINTNTIYIGPGESVDAIFIAPPKTGAGYDTYLLYNRNSHYLHNPGIAGLGGQITEIRVYAEDTLPQQTAPNT